MNDKKKKDPYHFEKIENGLKKRFRVIVSEREKYKRKEENNPDAK